MLDLMTFPFVMRYVASWNRVFIITEIYSMAIRFQKSTAHFYVAETHFAKCITGI